MPDANAASRKKEMPNIKVLWLRYAKRIEKTAPPAANSRELPNAERIHATALTPSCVPIIQRAASSDASANSVAEI